MVDFIFDYETKQFKSAFVVCNECGITTQLEENIEDAIKTWQKAFSEDYSEYYDDCTGCSGNFGKEEYY